MGREISTDEFEALHLFNERCFNMNGRSVIILSHKR
jgi:hypothetical protein